jgi:hypothetical protein
MPFHSYQLYAFWVMDYADDLLDVISALWEYIPWRAVIFFLTRSDLNLSIFKILSVVRNRSIGLSLTLEESQPPGPPGNRELEDWRVLEVRYVLTLCVNKGPTSYLNGNM